MSEKEQISNVFENVDVLMQDKYRKRLIYKGKSRPLTIALETVSICNYSCIMCAYGKMTRPKMVMPMDLFELVLQQYTEIGGGAMAIHPVAGDIFLDKFLVERYKLMGEYEKITGVYFFTNGTCSDRFGEEDLKLITEKTARITVSFYGLDAEEHAAITGVDDYDRAVRSAARLIAITNNADKIILSFRLLKKRTREEMKEWVERNTAGVKTYGASYDFGNWGGAMDEHVLDNTDGKIGKISNNNILCRRPLSACRIYSNGDVSFCPCMDFNGDAGLALGNVREQSLAEIYNSAKTKKLWSAGRDGSIPDFCRKCSFHATIDDLSAVDRVLDLIPEYE